MRIVVESIEGLDWTMQEIFAKKPVIIIGEDYFDVLPLRAHAGELFTLADKDGKEMQIRMRPIEKITRSR